MAILSPTDDLELFANSELNKAQRNRAIARERIATLYRMSKDSNHSAIPLLQQKLDDENLSWLAGYGFIYSREDLDQKLKNYVENPQAADPTKEFIKYLLNLELDAYITEHEKVQQSKVTAGEPAKQTMHLQLYKDLKQLSVLEANVKTLQDNSPEKIAAIKDIEKLEASIAPRMQAHQENASLRKFSARVSFMQENKIKIPQDFIRQVNEHYGYEDWDGTKPLPDVNLKRESADKAEIRVADIGVSLAQLYKIMRESTDTVSEPNVSCHGRENPFRSIVFQLGNPAKDYTLISHLEKNANGNPVFMVKPCLLSDMKNGTPKVAEVEGWMANGKVDDLSPAQALANALLKLAKFSLSSELKKEEKQDEVDEALEIVESVPKNSPEIIQPDYNRDTKPESSVERQTELQNRQTSQTDSAIAMERLAKQAEDISELVNELRLDVPKKHSRDEMEKIEEELIKEQSYIVANVKEPALANTAEPSQTETSINDNMVKKAQELINQSNKLREQLTPASQAEEGQAQEFKFEEPTPGPSPVVKEMLEFEEGQAQEFKLEEPTPGPSPVVKEMLEFEEGEAQEFTLKAGSKAKVKEWDEEWGDDGEYKIAELDPATTKNIVADTLVKELNMRKDPDKSLHANAAPSIMGAQKFEEMKKSLQNNLEFRKEDTSNSDSSKLKKDQ